MASMVSNNAATFTPFTILSSDMAITSFAGRVLYHLFRMPGISDGNYGTVR
jgi:hypothetical protein